MVKHDTQDIEVKREAWYVIKLWPLVALRYWYLLFTPCIFTHHVSRITLFGLSSARTLRGKREDSRICAF